MKQKKTKTCSGCDRRFSPEGLQAHKALDKDTGYNACEFYARNIRPLREARTSSGLPRIITTDWDKMEKNFATS